MFLNILVAVDGSASSRRALQAAIDIAKAMNSMLTMISGAPPLSHYVTLAGVSSQTMREELDKWAGNIIAEASAGVPDDVIVHAHNAPDMLGLRSPRRSNVATTISSY